jgi:murein DD-endopeptidase MepM/ murein hydrolase activator NlpD
MSAILQYDGAMGANGIRKYHTTCRVIVNSHNSDEPIDVSQDVINVNTQKFIKGTGTLSITLLGSYNYLQKIHPNDYVNLYINIGDGVGWTRVFFGFVDLVKETYSVAETGEPSTHYTLACSDFQKAFEKTDIYFNAYMSQRKDFGGKNFGTTNIGGLAMMTRGITSSGSPANFIHNLTLMLLGFGTQFVLPKSCRFNPSVLLQNRRARRQFLSGAVGETIQKAIGGLSEDALRKLQEEITKEAEAAAGEIVKMNQKDAVKTLISQYGVNAELAVDFPLSDVDTVSKVVRDAVFKKKLGIGKGDGSYTADDNSPILLDAALQTFKGAPTLLDLVDMFSLVETDSIDGWQTEIGIWQRQGTLGQILRSFAHEEINEFFFDLRPMSGDESTEYFVASDEMGGNLENGKPGIQYLPAIVMREYPFGTITRIDASSMKLSLRKEGGNASLNQEDLATVGIVEVGALFSDNPNVPGRHTIEQPAISWAARATGQDKTATRYLDVAVITSDQIIESELSRSDDDMFNLFEVWSDSFQISDAKWMMADVLPIVTPIHVMRHGLRTRTFNTPWARCNLAIANKTEKPHNGSAALPNPEKLAEEAVGEIAESKLLANAATGTPERDEDLAPTASYVTPVALDPTDSRIGKVNAKSGLFGYRSRLASNNAVRDISEVAPAGGKWVMHQGVDIKTVVGTPIRAVADGVVVVSAPNGVYASYGQTVVIKSKSAAGQIFYTVYAHLSSRTEAGGGAQTSPTKHASASKGMNGGTFQPIKVTAGTIIGEAGITQGTLTDKEKLFSSASRCHLHYEVNIKAAGRSFPANQSLEEGAKAVAAGGVAFAPDVEIPAGTTVADPAYTQPTMGTTHPTGVDVGFNPRLLDPVQFHLSVGAPLTGSAIVAEEDDIDTSEAEEREETDALSNVGNDQDDTDPTSVDSNIRSVDNVDARRSCIRWGLLQDHWYQHNLEYLSGQIVMRGAPEIRAGYRLDIADKGLSFYIDGVNHSWSYPENMRTALTVSRGQPNSPCPMYVMPPAPAFVDKGDEQRSINSRLKEFFVIPDPPSVTNSVVFRQSGYTSGAERKTVSDIPDETSSLSTSSGLPTLDVFWGEYVIYSESDSKTVEALASLAKSKKDREDAAQARIDDIISGISNVNLPNPTTGKS